LNLLKGYANLARQGRLRHPQFLADDPNVSADDDVSFVLYGARHHPIRDNHTEQVLAELPTNLSV
jgi:hypothetical protein